MKKHSVSLAVSVALMVAASMAVLAVEPAATTTPVQQQPTAAQLLDQAPVVAQATAPAAVTATNMMSVSSSSVLAAKDILNVTKSATTGRSDKYPGVLFTLKNTQPYHLQVLQGEVLGGIDEMQVAQEEQERKNNSRKLIGGLLKGASSLPFVGGFGYASVGAYRAAAIGSNLVNATGDAMQMSNATASLQGRFVRQFSGQIINPNEVFTFTTLVPKNAGQPQVKLIFKNLETNQIYDLVQ